MPSSSIRAFRTIDQVLGQKIQQHAVVKRAVTSSFVLPHDAHSPEADALVRTDGANVVGRWIDGDAVMPSLLEEEGAHQAYRLGPEALPLVMRGEEDIDARVPVVAMQVLPSRNPAYRLGVRREDEGGDALCPIGIVPGEKLVPVEVVIGLAPMASNLRFAEALQEAWQIVFVHGSKDDAWTLKEELHLSFLGFVARIRSLPSAAVVALVVIGGGLPVATEKGTRRPERT